MKKAIRNVLTPGRVLFAAFSLLSVTVLSHALRNPAAINEAPPETQSEPELELPKTDFATVTGPKVVYVVPEGTGRITARIKSPTGVLVREFIITNWVTIRPGQQLELTAEPARQG